MQKIIQYIQQNPSKVIVGIVQSMVAYIILLVIVVYISKSSEK